jgi:hypothetical protein
MEYSDSLSNKVDADEVSDDTVTNEPNTRRHRVNRQLKRFQRLNGSSSLPTNRPVHTQEHLKRSRVSNFKNAVLTDE